MIDITQYKQVGKGCLIGKFSIRVQKWGGFIIRDMAYFQQGHKRWIGFPCRQFEVEGEKKYISFNSFEDGKTGKLFQDEVLKSLDEYFKKNTEF